MLNNTAAHDSLVARLTAVRDDAARKLEVCARRLKNEALRNGPLVDLYQMDLDQAFDALDVAQDDLREVRDGYRHTYPHPAALAPHGSRYPVR